MPIILKLILPIIIAFSLLGCFGKESSITFRINGINNLQLPNSFLSNSNISPLDNFLITTREGDSIHISTLTPEDLNISELDMRLIPELILGIKVDFPKESYAEELKKAHDLHVKIYPTTNNKTKIKDNLKIYTSENNGSAVMYISHKEINSQITLIHLKSNNINFLTSTIIKGITYDEPKS